MRDYTSLKTTDVKIMFEITTALCHFLDDSYISGQIPMYMIELRNRLLDALKNGEDVCQPKK